MISPTSAVRVLRCAVLGRALDCILCSVIWLSLNMTQLCADEPTLVPITRGKTNDLYDLGRFRKLSVSDSSSQVLAIGDRCAQITDSQFTSKELSLRGLVDGDINTDATTVILATEKGDVFHWDIRNRTVQPIPRWTEGESRSNCPRASLPRLIGTGGQMAAAMANDSAPPWIGVFNVKSGQLQHRLVGHKSEITHLAVSKKPKWIASADQSGTVYVWEFKSQSIDKELFKSDVREAGSGINQNQGVPVTIAGLWFINNDQGLIVVSLTRVAEDSHDILASVMEWELVPYEGWSLVRRCNLVETEPNTNWSKVQVSPDGKFLAVFENGNALIAVRELATMIPVARLELFDREEAEEYEQNLAFASFTPPPLAFEFSANSRSLFIGVTVDHPWKESNLWEFTLPHSTTKKLEGPTEDDE